MSEGTLQLSRLWTPSGWHTPDPPLLHLHSHRSHLGSAAALILPQESDQSHSETVPLLRICNLHTDGEAKDCARFPHRKGSVNGEKVCSRVHTFFYFSLLQQQVYMLWHKKTHISFLIMSCPAALYSLSVSAPVSLRVPSQIPFLLWLVSSHTPEPALLTTSVVFSSSS